MSSLTRDLSYLRTLGFGDVDLARAGGVVDAVGDPGWEQALTDGPAAPRIIELAAAAERLEPLIDRPHIASWLRSALPILGWSAPLDLIGRDEYAPVADLIEAMEDQLGDDA